MFLGHVSWACFFLFLPVSSCFFLFLGLAARFIDISFIEQIGRHEAGPAIASAFG
jgi:hypothetical protein